MVSHDERLATARSAVDYICSRTDSELAIAVPNCPGWTVYNAAVHIGRVGVAWHSMIQATPDDPDSRVRGYADAESRGSGHAPDVLASWAIAALDALDDDTNRPCYFSMTGGDGTVGLWGTHAASELGIHRLDVESALGHDHSMTAAQAVDAINYTADFFLPAMLRATEQTLPGLDIAGLSDGTPVLTRTIGATAEEEPPVSVSGAAVDVLLALWGRPHGDLDISGSRDVLDQWLKLPGQAFQFGTWD